MEHTVLRYEKEVKYINNENKTNINCEEWANAKLPKNVQK